MHLFIHTYMYIHNSYIHNRYIFVDDLFIEKKTLDFFISFYLIALSSIANRILF